MSLLVISGAAIRLGGRTHPERRRPHGGSGPPHRPGRPQRRRQIHAAARDRRRDAAGRRRHPPRRPRPHRDRRAGSARRATPRCWTPCCKATPNASPCSPKPTPPPPIRLAEIHERLRAIGADAAPARAAAILAGLGFDEAAQAAPGRGILRRLAHARGAGHRAVRRPRPAAARRTDQPPRPGSHAVAGNLARAASPAPRCWSRTTAACWTARCRRSPSSTAASITVTPGGFDEFVRIRTERAMQQIARRRAHRRRTRAYPVVHRPLPLQGEQGAPGAVAHQGARPAAADRDGDRGRAHPLRLPRTRRASRRRS